MRYLIILLICGFANAQTLTVSNTMYHITQGDMLTEANSYARGYEAAKTGGMWDLGGFVNLVGPYEGRLTSESSFIYNYKPIRYRSGGGTAILEPTLYTSGDRIVMTLEDGSVMEFTIRGSNGARISRNYDGRVEYHIMETFPNYYFNQPVSFDKVR